jgi:hypothetical protein
VSVGAIGDDATRADGVLLCDKTSPPTSNAPIAQSTTTATAHPAIHQRGYDLRFGRPPFVSHQKWHGWNCQVDIIPHGCCPVAETKINAHQRGLGDAGRDAEVTGCGNVTAGGLLGAAATGCPHASQKCIAGVSGAPHCSQYLDWFMVFPRKTQRVPRSTV